MKKIFLLMLILLTSCSPIASPTPSSFFDPTIPLNTVPELALLNLTADSTSEQIQSAMLSSAARWRTIQMSGDITWYAPDGSTQSFRE